MQVKSIAECSPWSILQYFRPSLSYHLSLRSLFYLFLSGRLRQVLLYKVWAKANYIGFAPQKIKVCRSELQLTFTNSLLGGGKRETCPVDFIGNRNEGFFVAGLFV